MANLEQIEKEVEQKLDAIPNKTRFIPWIIILVLCGCLVFGNHLYQKEKTAKEKLISDNNIAKTIDDIEQPGLAEIAKREERAAQLRKQRADIDKKLAAILKNDKVSKSNLEAKKNEIQKASVGTINRMFILRGYSTTIIR